MQKHLTFKSCVATVALAMLAGVYTSPSQAQNTITNGLAAYWNFAEPAGTPVVLDVTGNGNNGQMFNFVGTERQPGIVGQALYFGGPSTQDYIQITNCNIKPPNTMSLAVWVNIPTSFSFANSPWTTIVKNWPGSAANPEAYFGLNGSSGAALFYLNNSSLANVHVAESTALPQGQWVHLAFTADGSYLNIYRNGVYESRVAYNGTINANILTNTMGIGVELTNGGVPYASNMGYWQGWMDDLAIWGRALTATEIQTIYQAGKMGMPLTNAYAYLTLTAYTAAQNVYATSNAVFSVANSSGSSLGYQWQVTDGVSVTNNLTNGLTLSGSTVFGATAVTLTVSNVSSLDAGSYYTCLITNAASSATNSPLAPLTLLVSTNVPVTRPGDSIADFYNAIGTAVPYPSGLGAANILDGTLAPYLNYGEYGQYSTFTGPVGYVVTPSIGGSVVTAARIYTSTNAPADDPADCTLYGSNDGVTWSLIATTNLSLPMARNASSGTINSNNQVLQEIDFPNTNGYYQYAVYFTNAVGAGNATMGLEFAEVQLLGGQSLQAPEIFVQPAPAVQPMQIGGSMTWSIVAAGVGEAYQWYEGSTTNPVLGTAASFTLANVTTNSSGSYFCVVSNAYGSVTSSIVTVSALAPSSAYVSTVMADHPIAFYRLDEGPYNGAGNQGWTAYDSAGGHDGVYTNIILQVPGYCVYDPDDYAAQFGGWSAVNSYVGSINGIDFSSPAATPTNFSVEAWVNLFAAPSAGEGIVAKANGSGQQFALDTGGTGNAFRFYFYNATASSAFPCSPNVAPSPNTWYHLVGVLNESANTMYLYTNGVQAAKTTVTANSGVRTLAGPVTIGCRPDTSGGYTMQVRGSIANVALYNYALTAAQVTNHYAATPKAPLVLSLVPTVPGLQAGFTGTGDATDSVFDRELICTYNNTYSFVDTGPVTYTVTYGSVPPGNTYSMGVIGFDQTGVNPVPEYTDPTFFAIYIVKESPSNPWYPGTNTMVFLECKTNLPNGSVGGAVVWNAPSPTVGTWSFTISNNVNIYCVAPNGSSTNLPFPLGFQSVDVENNFAGGLYVYLGAESGVVGDQGSQWVIKNFSITNNGVATLVEDFAAEANAGDPGPVPGAQYVPWIPMISQVPWRDTAYSANPGGTYTPNPKGVFLISANTPYFLDWNTIQGSGLDVLTNTTLAQAGWGTNTFLTTNAYLFGTYYRTEVTNLPPSQAMFFELKK